LIQEELGSVLTGSVCGSPGPVGEAMRYAVLNGGSRIRPLLALGVARLCDADSVLALRAAAAVEILHAASLVVDDLPCMDNAPERRGQPAVHVAFGEATAMLAAFALVALAARSVAEQACRPGLANRQRQFQIDLLRTLDCSGLVGGQSLDVTLDPEQREESRAFVNELKTVPLFDLAVKAGLAYSAAEPSQALGRLGFEFGVAFQMADDLDDGETGDPAAVAAQWEAVRACVPPGRRASSVFELIDYLHARSIANHPSCR
jgi:geranylgeranyl pyrophosphate synthase